MKDYFMSKLPEDVPSISRQKCVYQLAVDTYRKAKNTDSSIGQQAQDRINALSNSVPTKEDYFFRKLKSGTVIPITAQPFWLDRTYYHSAVMKISLASDHAATNINSSSKNI
ncbi:MAG: hypothetical protein MZV64_64610 [Ignavibacteriales bacterium]|nr:hypothetical protein [Ignavibacteriales bacterium]